ncbi:MAG: phosphatase PAP2 family protein [Myxococcota bacterium]
MKWARAIRPLEWALFAFVLFVVVRVGPRVFLEWRELAGLRTVTVFFALALVGFVDLARRYRKLSWPEGTSSTRRLQRVLFPLALLPLVGATLAAVTNPALREGVAAARAAQALPMLATVTLRVVGFGLPTLALWTALGLHAKETGRLDARRALSTSLAGLAQLLRDWTPLLLILSAYAWMDAVVQGHLAPEQDALMAAIDRVLFGGVDPLDLFERIIWTPLSEWLAFAYSFYAILYPLVLGGIFMFAGRAALRESCFILGVALLVGYVSYSLVPVKGPLLTRTFSVSLDYYLIGPVKEAMMDATRITWDCFPSMHTCCTVLMGWCCWRHVRRLFWTILPVVVSMPVACIYLRYHYVIDVLAGLVLAAVMIAVTARFQKQLAGPAESAP